MHPPFDPWLSTSVAVDVGMASRASAEALAALQEDRLAALLESASRRSPMYRRLLKGHGTAKLRLKDMPIMHKAELMRRFDEWCIDPAIRLDALRRFVADPANVGTPFLGRYIVWESSGSSGEPGVFVQDAAAMAVYDALEALRKPDLRPLRRVFDPWMMAERVVFIGAVGGHFASTVSIERLRLLNPILSTRLSSVSFLQPIERLAAELQEHAPTVLTTYPSAAVLLARESLAGRLKIEPKEIWTGGETLSPAMRAFVQDAFGCPVVNSYGTSEFLSLASECLHGSLHLNSDWAILEPVDCHGKAVPPGTDGTTTLLTNLANHLQPLIRYDIGDRVTLHADKCACGSALPVLEVQGRCDDTLRFDSHSGRTVRVLPLALSTVLEDDAGLFDFQVIQLGPGELSLSTGARGAAATDALRRARGVLGTFLKSQGAAKVRIRCHRGRPPHRGRSGKLQRIVACRA